MHSGEHKKEDNDKKERYTKDIMMNLIKGISLAN